MKINMIYALCFSLLLLASCSGGTDILSDEQDTDLPDTSNEDDQGNNIEDVAEGSDTSDSETNEDGESSQEDSFTDDEPIEPESII